MDLSNLKPSERSKKNRKRVGRGHGTGQGAQAGRGHKGAQSRSGYKRKRGFEGGQMPLHRRVPKRGFHNEFRIEYAVENLDALAERFDDGTVITLGLLRVYRVGSHIPTPGVNSEALLILAEQARNTMFGLYDMFSGQNLSRVTIFALGIMPYISSSIILQLLTVVWPYLERLSKEGVLGRRKITQYTRYLTLALAVVQALGIAILLERNTELAGGLPLVYSPGWGFRLLTVLTLTTGTTLIMWLGEQITERGIGNGMSLIIYAGIAVGLPGGGITTFDQLRTGQMGRIRLILLIVVMVLVIAAIIFVERGHRRITVQY